MEMALRMMMAFTYLPAFVTVVWRGMPTVWRGRHRLLLCWLIFMQAVSPGRKTLEERARWTPATMTAWRFGRLRKATYGNVPLIVRWLAQDLVTTLPPPMACCSSLETEVTPTHAAPKIPERRKGGTVNIIPGFLACASSC